MLLIDDLGIARGVLAEKLRWLVSTSVQASPGEPHCTVSLSQGAGLA